MIQGRGGIVAAAIWSAVGFAPSAQAADSAARTASSLEAFLRVRALVGREAPAAAFLRSYLGAEVPAQSDRLGSLVVTLGSGAPRRLVVCPLGEAGYAVTGIESNGYLRLGHVGRTLPLGALSIQALEGHVVTIEGANGPVAGAVAVKSVHLRERSDRVALPFALSDAWVDVGAENAEEVTALGIRLLDPVVPEQPPALMANGRIAGPSARLKAACLAAADAARSLHPAAGSGTVVFAWTAQDLMNNGGLELVLREHGPFTEAIALDGGFGWKSGEDGLRLETAPNLGSGPVVAGALEGSLGGAHTAPHQAPSRRAAALGWPTRAVSYAGIPAQFIGTPVETVSLGDVEQLSAALVTHLGGSAVAPPPAQAPTSPSPAAHATLTGHEKAAELLGSLIAQYGTSGNEDAVRKAVLERLPPWAHPRVDAAGNIQVHLGPSGPGGVLFVAHLDEVGWKVSEVLADGRLKLEVVGGALASVWEGQAAVVHGDHGPLPAVFEPRTDWWTAITSAPAGALIVNLGVTSASAASELGVRVGTSVTMPKQMHRLGPHRAVGRSMDDRVGSSVLLMALERIDPAKVNHPLTFAWSTGEEVGLDGATALAHEMATAGAPARVHAVDTFVSSDSPLESHAFANLPLGHGAVLRVLDNGLYASTAIVDFSLGLARQRHIPLQVGATGGSTDGVPFVGLGAAVLPISWPGRYSHSPIEVADFRDIEALTDLVVALATADGP
jgi:putative aminopeptidase FrvX